MSSKIKEEFYTGTAKVYSKDVYIPKLGEKYVQSISGNHILVYSDQDIEEFWDMLTATNYIDRPKSIEDYAYWNYKKEICPELYCDYKYVSDMVKDEEKIGKFLLKPGEVHCLFNVSDAEHSSGSAITFCFAGEIKKNDKGVEQQFYIKVMKLLLEVKENQRGEINETK
jgi:hypothetical protein